MPSLNRVMLIGRLTRDPELKRIREGVTLSNLGLAVNEQGRSKEGENIERTAFIDVVVWNKQAEVCETYLSKGSSVLIEGRLQMDQWEDKDGNRRQQVRVKADRVHFMDTGVKHKREPSSRAEEHALA